MADFNGGGGDDSYTGSEGRDLISGGGGDDRLDGAGGDDVIDGGPGTNMLLGGTGADAIYSFGHHDDIDGGEGDNQIHVHGTVGGTIDGGLTDYRGKPLIRSDLFFVDASFDATSGTMIVRNFRTVSGRLIGTDGADRLDLSSLTAGRYSGSFLTIVGGAGRDSIDGSNLRDIMFGDAQFPIGGSEVGAADILRGRGGDDEIQGGVGDDHINGGNGYDLLQGGSGADVVLGGSGGDIIYGSGDPGAYSPEAVADRLHGGAGSDIIYGGYGDTIDGGTGGTAERDQLWLDLSGGTAGVSADFSAIGNDGMLAIGGGSITGIEELIDVVGTRFADDLTIVGTTRLLGGGGDDRLTGSEMGNNLAGESGDDAIHGLDGNDFIRGGGGNDVIDGGEGDDALGYGLYATAPEAGDDIMTGGAGADRLSGGDGDDMLNGGADWDELHGGEGIDTASYAGSSGPITVRLDLTDYQHTFSSGNDRLWEIENLIGSDFGDDLTGNSGDNRLAGAAGDDELDGGDGSDTLVGGIGADFMRGGAGDDFYIVSDRGDQPIEAAGGGRDTVMSTIDYRLGDTLEELRLAGTAVNGSGNGGDNAILGNRADNRLNGLDGADTLDGSAGDDALSGNAGDDILIGGAGRDTLTGGSGADIFRFDDGDSAAAAGQSDVIAGFSRGGGDRIDLSAIDADTGSDADEGFAFIGSAAFSGAAGELRATTGNGLALVQGDVDGDGSADFTIRVDAPTIAATDFIL